MKGRSRAAPGLLVVIGVSSGCAVALQRLGSRMWLRVDWSDPAGWLTTVPAVDGLAAALRIAGLGLALWVTATTALHLVAVATGTARAIRLTGLLVLPPLRPLVNAAAAGTVAVASFQPVALAVTTPEPPRPVTVATDGLDAQDSGRDGRPDPAWSALRPRAAIPPASDPAGTLPQGAVEVTVVPGDNLWSLAEHRLSEVRGRPPGVGEVAPYWVEVIAANRHRIRSGDPDLIFPGEVIVLPPVGPDAP
ncbi:MAG: hypothetical protein R6X29_06075 [Acidimicrobiia bacterium]|jgi:nucleoid-associated protein YgaU